MPLISLRLPDQTLKQFQLPTELYRSHPFLAQWRAGFLWEIVELLSPDVGFYTLTSFSRPDPFEPWVYCLVTKPLIEIYQLQKEKGK